MGKFNLLPSMVFPSTKMNSVNKLITEGSLTRLINNLIDTNSYIIPPASANLTEYSLLNNETVVPVTNTSESIEFILGGYYFNLGSIKDIFKHYSDNVSPLTSGQYFLSAQIFIDDSGIDYPHSYYPELRGEQEIVISSDKMNATLTTSAGNEVVSSTLLLTNVTVNGNTVNIDKSSIKSIEFFDSSDELYCSGYVDSDSGEIRPNEVLGDIQCRVVVTYYEYSNIINLYLTPVGQTPEFSDLGDDASTETINLIYADWDSNVNEISSVMMSIKGFHKLKHHSIESIDGGIL